MWCESIRGLPPSLRREGVSEREALLSSLSRERDAREAAGAMRRTAVQSKHGTYTNMAHVRANVVHIPANMEHIRQSRSHAGHRLQVPNPSGCALFARERNTPGREVRRLQARSNRCRHSPGWALPSPRSIRPQPAIPPCLGRQGTPSVPVKLSIYEEYKCEAVPRRARIYGS